MEFSIPFKVILIKDKDHGLDACIVIDTIREGNACGGIRILHDVDVEEAKILARSMTMKYGFILNSSVGGGKAFIRIPKNCSRKKKLQLIRQFAIQAATIMRNNVYSPNIDMNCSEDDIHFIYKTLGLKRPLTGDSSYFTALSLYSSILACTEAYGPSQNELRIIIAGFGNVATYLAEEIKNTGMKITGISNLKGAIYNKKGLDVDKLIGLRKRYGDDFLKHYLKYDKNSKAMPRDEILKKECEILVPAARPNSINKNNMKHIKAKMIIPAANSPYDYKATEYLSKKGVLLFPDFVSSCGGVYGASLVLRGMSEKCVRSLIVGDFLLLVKKMIMKRKKENKSLIDMSEEIAMENIKKKTEGERPILKTKVKISIKDFIRLLPQPFKNIIYSKLEKTRLSKLTML